MPNEERQRRQVHVFDPSAFDADRPSVDLSLGTGAKLRNLPEWPRGRSDTFEEAMIPLHRLVFGTPGRKGERREALKDFCGFEPTMAEKQRAKISQWSKAQLQGVVVALGIKGVKLSQPVAPLQREVFEFLNKPSIPEPVKKPSIPITRTSADPKSSEGSPPKQRVKKESTATVRAPVLPDTIPDDTVRVEVYKRILAMDVAEHSKVSPKSLRQAIEKAFGLDEDALKARKHIIEEVATACIRSIRDVIKSFGSAIGSESEHAASAPAPLSAPPASSEQAPP